uniref:RBR-type E3 ubiquitin transferase n=1 Tax=Octopus bimaculoides TaxID=37653 RepID=A0A0L8HRQ0_OCTBM
MAPVMATYSGSKNTVELAIDPLITCKLCLTECSLQEMYEIRDCRCLYCEACVKQYLSVMIQEGNVLSITCPDAQCKKQGKFDAPEIEQLVSRSTFERYSRLRFQKEVDVDPNRMFCPQAGCETVCYVFYPSPEDKLKPISVECPQCGFEFCSVCKNKWHAIQSCDEVMSRGKAEDIGIPYSNIEDAQIKRCPVCHVPIERNDGCAQMMCKRCKHVFCWYCLASLDVVGIFAGFGVLLLIASPFLLMAAPCILCCKCKLCKCCEDEEGESLSS